MGGRERRQQGRVITGYSPEREVMGARAAQAEPRQPKDGADSGLPAYNLDWLGDTEAEHGRGKSRARLHAVVVFQRCQPPSCLPAPHPPTLFSLHS